MQDHPGCDADALRERAGCEGVPVDVVNIARHVGLRLYTWHACPRSISGFLYRGGWDTWIVVNGANPITRRRFTIAHELHHWLTGAHGPVTLMAACDDWLSPEEQEANMFASVLLMPADAVRREVAERVGFHALCSRFEVSRQAMTNRLRALGMEGTE